VYAVSTVCFLCRWHCPGGAPCSGGSGTALTQWLYVQYCTVLYAVSTEQYFTVHYNTLLYCTVLVVTPCSGGKWWSTCGAWGRPAHWRARDPGAYSTSAVLSDTVQYSTVCRQYSGVLPLGRSCSHLFSSVGTAHCAINTQLTFSEQGASFSGRGTWFLGALLGPAAGPDPRQRSRSCGPLPTHVLRQQQQQQQRRGREQGR